MRRNNVLENVKRVGFRAKMKDLVLNSSTKHLIHFNKKKVKYVYSYAGGLADLLL